MNLLVLDNYDSFTYNLVYLLRKMGLDPSVIRNDRIEPEETTSFDGILFSPGPGIPAEAGNMPAIIRKNLGRTPMLGVCLGHQALAEFLGGRLANMPVVYHGIQSVILQTGAQSLLLKNIPDSFRAGRYHSWEVVWDQPVTGVEITAKDPEGCIMAFEDSGNLIFGFQFHPESILTPEGPRMLENFLALCKNRRS